MAQALQRPRGRLGHAAPAVDGPLAAEARLQVRGMGGAAGAHEGQHLGGEAGGGVASGLARRVVAGMEQVAGAGGHEPVGVQEVFLQAQAPEAPVEVAGAVAADPVAEDQILGAGGRADRVGLHEAEPVHGVAKGGGGEQGGLEDLGAEVCEGDGHGRKRGWQGVGVGGNAGCLLRTALAHARAHRPRASRLRRFGAARFWGWRLGLLTVWAGRKPLEKPSDSMAAPRPQRTCHPARTRGRNQASRPMAGRNEQRL